MAGSLTSGASHKLAKTSHTSANYCFSNQLNSWFEEYGDRHCPGLIGQIFFQTNEYTLDPSDCAVLDALAGKQSILLLGKSVRLEFAGHADCRGSDRYNLGLGLKRARSVQLYVDSLLKKYQFYSSRVRTLGESGASKRCWAPDRRVDIWSSYVPKRPYTHFEPITITGEYTGPLSKKFEFRTLVGASVGISVVAGQVFSIEIRNSRTKRSAMYTYTGAGPGIGFSYNRPSGWDEKEIPAWLDVDDFEGNGRVLSFGVGKSGTVLVFDGPKERGKTRESISLGFDGWDIEATLEGDCVGYWHRR
ncbi:MAG TPA: hypothetical protein VI431_09980 [Candidatus Acidoferrum sp.]